ncbi:hypothetical protein B0T17DRAFT_545601 [Bombardia bombarda]|uniref:Mitochondrial inner membrane protein 1 n=1 Tax=Bombardia bombarda TaxID=252184 RepID=A0AA39TJW9_9PEZI|nr:hypothetical protein B0T17DRAFT_545601 [Bombardia bombarda]
MLRSTRSVLGSAQKLTLASRIPHASLISRPAPSNLLASSSQAVALSRTTTPRVQLALFSSKTPLQPNKIDKDFEKEAGQKKLVSDPSKVTTQSSVRHVFEQGQAPKEPDVDMLKDLKKDLNTVKETVALNSVPRGPYTIGLAGTLPYFATSLSTIYLSWDLNTMWPTQSSFLNSFMVPHETAAHWLTLLEPIQVGYGAVIITFIGAMHLGRELGETLPSRERTRFRYTTAVTAPALAWSTHFMPIEWALITQFLTFTGLYFADARAATRGWMPSWYATYRFVLTAIVGAAIFVSLVGRAKIGGKRNKLSSGDLEDLLGQDPEKKVFHNWAKEEEEERERLKKEKEEEEKKKAEEEKKKAEEKQKGKGGKNGSSEKKDGGKGDGKEKGN